jgi:hypothetical protein
MDIPVSDLARQNAAHDAAGAEQKRVDADVARRNREYLLGKQ